MMNDSVAAYTHGLRWALGGEKAHAEDQGEVSGKTKEPLAAHGGRLAK